MKAVADKIIVKVAKDEEVTKSGIILSNMTQERKYEGTVISVGDDPFIEKSGVKEGSYVFYPKGLNIEVIKDDEPYDIVSIYDILAVGEQ